MILVSGAMLNYEMPSTLHVVRSCCVQVYFYYFCTQDVDLLNECHEEMRRRMKVYKNWKTKNKPQVADQKSHLPLSGGKCKLNFNVWYVHYFV